MYSLYKGDSFIDLGTKQYLANLLNVKIETITYYMTPAHRKRVKSNAYIVIKIEDDCDKEANQNESI